MAALLGTARAHVMVHPLYSPATPSSRTTARKTCARVRARVRVRDRVSGEGQAQSQGQDLGLGFALALTVALALTPTLTLARASTCEKLWPRKRSSVWILDLTWLGLG